MNKKKQKEVLGITFLRITNWVLHFKNQQRENITQLCVWEVVAAHIPHFHLSTKKKVFDVNVNEGVPDQRSTVIYNLTKVLECGMFWL